MEKLDGSFADLKANLLELFTAQYELSQALSDTLVENLDGFFEGLNNKLEGLFRTQDGILSGIQTAVESLDTFFGTTLAKEYFNEVKDAVKSLDNCLSALKTSITETFNNNKMPDGYFKRVVDDSLAKDANNLAKTGNIIEATGNIIAAAGNNLSHLAMIANAITTDGFGAVATARGAMSVLASVFMASSNALAAGSMVAATGTALAFADGGFPSTGQMFLAREAGPELVGTIGRRTAVVNNDQIVESVSSGVYRAVREAMKGRGSDSSPLEVNLYLDGKQITGAVERIQRERGLPLMNRSLAMV